MPIDEDGRTDERTPPSWYDESAAYVHVPHAYCSLARSFSSDLHSLRPWRGVHMYYVGNGGPFECKQNTIDHKGTTTRGAKPGAKLLSLIDSDVQQ